MNLSKARCVGLGRTIRALSNRGHIIIHVPLQRFSRTTPMYCRSQFAKQLSFSCISERSVKSSYKCHHTISRFCISQYSTRVSIDRKVQIPSEIFPNPLCSINTLNRRLMAKLSCPPVFSCKFSVDGQLHVCVLELNWPESQVFTASAQTKKVAQSKASLQALHWLYSKRFITETSKPVLREDATTRNTLLFNFSESSIAQIDAVLRVHSEEIVPVLTALSTSLHVQENKVKQEARIHPTLGKPFARSEDLNEWSRTLQSCPKNPNLTRVLPIDSYRDNILETIKNNRVILLNGETGCGKTAKVPQFILDQAISEGKGAYCNIAVAQPRRMITIQSAKFVARERGEAVGQSVGYSVKKDSVLPKVPGGSIVFLTGMKLARKVVENPLLNGISHVILDEAHMRDIGTDLLMTLLKKALEINKELRVIVMSATVNTDVFQSYFNNCGEVAVLHIPGRTFPVKMHFLNDLQVSVVARGARTNLSDPQVDYKLVHSLVLWINQTKPSGGILIFVSGWDDMTELKNILSSEKTLLLICVHSLFRDSSVAFEPAPKGKRKVILATNIAETSVTFPDIVYVIDCGIHKKPQRNLLSPCGWSSSRMSSEWVSKANVKQRSGRAGRVQPGESFHLFTEQEFRKMNEFEMPSIMSESLEYIVLTVKTVNPGARAIDLMKEFPSPPPEKDVEQAVSTLQAANLLSAEERPTPLASVVMRLSTSLPSALALIYSSIYRCFSTTLSVISCEEANLILGPMHENSFAVRTLRESYHGSSDHLAKGKALNDPCLPFSSHPSYGYARDLQSFLRNQVTSMSIFFSSSNLDEFRSQELAQSVLLNCFGSLAVKSYNKLLQVHLNDKSGIPATVRSRSINCSKRNLKFPFLMYLSGQLSKDILVLSETTVVSPLSVLLFLPGDFQTMVLESIIIIKGPWRGNVRIVMKNEHYLRIQALRKALKDVFDYFIIVEALNQPDENNFELLCDFRKMLLQCLKDSLKLDWDQKSEHNEIWEILAKIVA